MKKPEGWHGFKINCDLYDFGMSNMSPPSSQQYCLRTDRKGRKRPYWIDHRYYEHLKCNWNSCPKLKEQANSSK